MFSFNLKIAQAHENMMWPSDVLNCMLLDIVIYGLYMDLSSYLISYD